eukprot:gene10789-11760_t
MIPVAEEEAPNVEGNTQISHSKNDPPQSFLNSPSSINTPDQIFEPSQFIMSYPEYLASILNKSFDPLSIKDKICPDFLSDLFQDYINNQIQYQQPVANNFQEAHALMKNILIKKNVKDNLISYRTDTKRGKRDYKIKTYRITLIEGK